jgi:two-component system, sensor histidine kinase and response regulator
MKVLIADDDRMTRELVEHTLLKLGHDCMTAADGLEAWDVFQDMLPSVAMIDWMMPGIDGPELCRRIRSHPSAAEYYPYIIFLTSMGEQWNLLRATEDGADEYLLKPLHMVELNAALISAQRVSHLYHQVAEERASLEAHLSRYASTTQDLEIFARCVSQALMVPLQRIQDQTKQTMREQGASLPPEIRDYLISVQHRTRHMMTIVTSLGASPPGTSHILAS